MTKQTLSVIVGSNNPVKINAVKRAISDVFPERQVECVGCNAPSGVADQPMTSQATRLGAINRVNYCKQHYQADFFAAIEGGVDLIDDQPATFAYVVVADAQSQTVGRSAALPLPHGVYDALVKGEELGDVMDRLFSTSNIKQKGGAIGLLTNNLATRESTYYQALLLAMAPYMHPEHY